MLPDKPSELIRVAINDLNEVSKLPNHEVAMSVWVREYHECCYFCLAGAVMINSLKIEDHLDEVRPWQDDEEITPASMMNAKLIDKSTRMKLSALNNFRVGDVSSAMAFHLGIKTEVENRDIVPYSKETHDQFCQQLLQIASELEAEGN